MSEPLARLEIEGELFESFPHLRVGGFAVRGLARASAKLTSETVQDLWKTARLGLDRNGVRLDLLATTPGIREWREAFAACGLKPSTYRSSVEALTRRVLKDGSVETPLPVVNAYCAISVSHLTPLGAYDLTRLPQRNLTLRRVRAETDHFEPLGGNPEQFPLSPRIVAYASGDTLICWSFNHRDSRSTCVQTDTETALFFGESLTMQGGETLEAALKDLQQLWSSLGAGVGNASFADSGCPQLHLRQP